VAVLLRSAGSRGRFVPPFVMVMMSVAVALLNVNAFRYPPAIRSSLSRLTYIEDHGVGGSNDDDDSISATCPQKSSACVRIRCWHHLKCLPYGILVIHGGRNAWV
jgi:hypothetical protein